MEIVAGVDEAGRGPLAGPVVASAVILPENHGIEGLADSKKLTAKKREKLFDKIYDIKKKYEKQWMADDEKMPYDKYQKMVVLSGRPRND